MRGRRAPARPGRRARAARGSSHPPALNGCGAAPRSPLCGGCAPTPPLRTRRGAPGSSPRLRHASSLFPSFPAPLPSFRRKPESSRTSAASRSAPSPEGQRTLRGRPRGPRRRTNRSSRQSGRRAPSPPLSPRGEGPGGSALAPPSPRLPLPSFRRKPESSRTSAASRSAPSPEGQRTLQGRPRGLGGAPTDHAGSHAGEPPHPHPLPQERGPDPPSGVGCVLGACGVRRTYGGVGAQPPQRENSGAGGWGRAARSACSSGMRRVSCAGALGAADAAWR